MLAKCKSESLSFDVSTRRIDPYGVVDPKIEILDDMTARFSARFDGPPGSQVIGRAWISDMDGTIVDGETGTIDAGKVEEMTLIIPEAKVQNGDLIACIRVEWPLYQTKQVVQCTLIEGDIVHPPKGKQC